MARPRHYNAIGNYRDRLIERIANSVDPAMASAIRELRLSWYSIKNAADTGDDNTTEVLIYDEIGGSFGVSAERFVSDLADINSPNITVRLNSPGGSLFDSITIYNALLQKRANIVTQVDGLAASGASIIAMAGDEVVMMPGSQMMIHDAIGMEMGNSADMRVMSDFLDKQSNNIADIYKLKAGGSRTEWRDMMLAETWMFAAEAVEAGLADRVFIPKKNNEPADEPADGENQPEEGISPENMTVAELEALMHRQFDEQLRNFKYPSREKAPDPGSNKKELLNVLRTTLGKVK